MENPVYHTLVKTITGVKQVTDKKIISDTPTEMTLHETCLGCHGTIVKASGMKSIDTKLGSIDIPNLINPSHPLVRPINKIGDIDAT